MPVRVDVVLWSGDAPDLASWRVQVAPGSRADLAADAADGSAALRFDFALLGHGAWAIARCERDFELPSDWVVRLRVRGAASPAELQVKLVDPAGANVWWWRRRAFSPGDEARRLTLRRAGLEFAWGPRSGAEPDHLGAVEIAVAWDGGASGTLWIEDLRVEARVPAEGALRPRSVRASSFVPGHGPERVLERDVRAGWRPDPRDDRPWIELDLGASREWGGLLMECEAGAPLAECRVLASEDGETWAELARDPGGPATRRWLRTGEAEARFVRLELAVPRPGGAGRTAPDAALPAVTRLEVVPIELAASPARFAASRARAVPRGRHPRHLLGEQGFWALVGGDGDERKGLLGEDGALEVDAEAFTLEPFLWSEGRLLTWADARTSTLLEAGCLPIPSVTWEAGGLRLRVTAFASGEAGRSALVARYVIESTGSDPREARLFVAIRPYQVTPAWQGLGFAGGVARIERLARQGTRITVDAREVVAVSAPDGFGAAPLGEGLAALWEGRLPCAEAVHDPLGFAEGALAFDLRLAPGGREAVVVAVPLFAGSPGPPAGLPRSEAAAWGEARLAEAAARWSARLAAVPISLPPVAAAFEESLRASLAWILVNREGPRIQPGPRAYRRSWIRDGALTGAALAEMGFAEELRAFLRWYAPHQHADGRVPCAVDRRGSDLAVEHDSHGQLVFGIVEVWRLGGDLAFLRELWPRALAAAGAIEALRSQRTGDAFRGDPRFGLLPESISHEGYASSPVHAYWDDFFAVRGLGDAADAADALGDDTQAERIGRLRDAMRRDLHASLALAMERHGIDFLPGSVELGDFDPTSTAIALDPCGEGARLPQRALTRTFERYWQELEARWQGEQMPEAWTPYEIRNAVALLRLGWKERALALLEWLIAEQRPPAWRQWPEVATREPRAPRFLGDLPHGWVASSFVRSLRRLLAYERDEDGVLVLAAGVPEAWVREVPGVRVRGLPTHFGPLDFTLCAEGEDAVRARIGGACRPPGGAVLESPLPRPLRSVERDGRRVSAADPRRVVLRELPADLLLRY